MEAAYPDLLTRRVASLLKKFLQLRNCSFVPRPLPRIQKLAAQHRQHKRRQQLVPEFIHMAWVPEITPLTDMQKHLPSSFQGECEEETLNSKSEHQNMKLVGTWHTPEQFVERAKQVIHPMDENAVASITKKAIDFVERSSPRLVSIERKKQLLKAKIKAKQLEQQEKRLHESLNPSVEKVVGDKKILLWKSLLQEEGYDDMELVKFMTEGVPLVGAHDHPQC